MKCDKCGEPIEDFRHAWQKAEGWTRRRKGGGTNALVLQRNLQVFMHEECMLKLRAGVPEQQGALL
jgi:hypothetical protein